MSNKLLDTKRFHLKMYQNILNAFIVNWFYLGLI